MTPLTEADREQLRREADDLTQGYLRSLPIEHFMESTAQSTKRKITVESFDLIAAARPDIQCFSELLVLYPRPGRRKNTGRVVPDNMVVVHPRSIEADGNYDLREQPTLPLLVIEYVSKHSQRKDNDENYDLYEKEVRVPYYLLYYPDNDELTLFRLTGTRYASVAPNEAGRLDFPELEVEVGLLDGWARYWFRGELLPLPAEWKAEMDAVRAELAGERSARQAAEARADAAEAEIARLRALLAERGA